LVSLVLGLAGLLFILLVGAGHHVGLLSFCLTALIIAVLEAHIVLHPRHVFVEGFGQELGSGHGHVDGPKLLGQFLAQILILDSHVFRSFRPRSFAQDGVLSIILRVEALGVGLRLLLLMLRSDHTLLPEVLLSVGALILVSLQLGSGVGHLDLHTDLGFLQLGRSRFLLLGLVGLRLLGLLLGLSVAAWIARLLLSGGSSAGKLMTLGSILSVV
jgi:hypothetical protein